MTKLLEIKDKIVKFYSNYEIYVNIVFKFIVAFTAFEMINLNVGYFAKTSNLTVALVLALFCSLLPTNAIIIFSGILIILDMYALSIEVAAIAILLFALIYLIYFRFSPKDGYIGVLTTILCRFNIPFIMPIAVGLLKNLQSAVAVVCGTVVYFFLYGIKSSATELTVATGAEKTENASKFNVTIGQLLGNKEMYLVILVFVLTTIVVWGVRKLKADHAWTIAIVLGTLIQLASLIIGYVVLGISGRTAIIIIGNAVSLLGGFVLEFWFMNLDYSRTERVQFEDDEYYYYVKAVPKKMVASGEKTVKHFGNTGSLGKVIDKRNMNTSIVNEETSKKVIAQELEIDEDLLD